MCCHDDTALHSIECMSITYTEENAIRYFYLVFSLNEQGLEREKLKTTAFFVQLRVLLDI